MPGPGLLSAAVALNVLTLNVWGLPAIGFLVPSPMRAERMTAICEVLREQAALPALEGWDVILLQEVWTAEDRTTLKNCGYTHSVDLENTQRALDSGLMILSRFPLREGKKLVFSEQASGDQAVSTGEAFTTKSALIAEVELAADQHVLVANTHLTSFYTRDEANDAFLVTRRVQWRQLVQWTLQNRRTQAGSPQPVILGGDFNFGPGFAQWREMDSSLGTWSQAPGAEAACTICPPNLMHSENEGKVDHLVGLSGLSAVSGQTEFTGTFTIPRPASFQAPYSDHFGYSTVFRLD